MDNTTHKSSGLGVDQSQRATFNISKRKEKRSGLLKTRHQSGTSSNTRNALPNCGRSQDGGCCLEAHRCVAVQDMKQTRQIFLRLVYGSRRVTVEYTYGCG